MITDDDIRAMLHAKAEEVTVSDDAWDAIAARLGQVDAPARRLPRRLALVGVAAAAIAGIVVVANLPGPATHVATPPSSTALAPAPATPQQAARTWLAERLDLGQVDEGTAQVQESDGTAYVSWHGGEVQTTVVVQQASGRKGWAVIAASSDLIVLHDVTYDGRTVRGTAVAETDGTLTIGYHPIEGKPVNGETRDVTRTEEVVLDHEVAANAGVAVRAVLRTTGGVFAISETAAQVLAHDRQDAPALWPATTQDGLDRLQADADRGDRPDLLDPVGAASGFMGDTFSRDDGWKYQLGQFRQGDANSGEVPVDILQGRPTHSTVIVRHDGPGKVWKVLGMTSDQLEVITSRREGNFLIVDVRVGFAGSLRGDPGGATLPVKAGQKVSLSFDGRTAGVVLTLTGTDDTRAVAAALLP